MMIVPPGARPPADRIESARCFTSLCFMLPLLCAAARRVGQVRGRGLAVECGVQAAVVAVGDPVLDGAVCAGAVGPGCDADLRLDGGEERLGGGAVETRSRAAGALPDLQASQRVPVGFRMVLPASSESRHTCPLGRPDA